MGFLVTRMSDIPHGARCSPGTLPGLALVRGWLGFPGASFFRCTTFAILCRQCLLLCAACMVALFSDLATAQSDVAPESAVGPAARSTAVPDLPPDAGRSTGPSAKVVRYAQRVVAAHDTNGDGRLQSSEWEQIQGQPESIDADRDGIITTAELVGHIVRFAARRRIRLVSPEIAAAVEEGPLLQPRSAPPASTQVDTTASSPGSADANKGALPTATNVPPAAGADPATEGATLGADPATEAAAKPVARRRDTKFFVPAGRLPSGLPNWFYSQDKDGDGQITLAEYAPSVTASSLAEFERYDRDRDGVITASECAPRAKSPASAKTRSAASESPPAKTAP